MAAIAEPALLGLKPSLGLGDAFGLAGPGHAAAMKGSDFGFFPALETLRDMTLLQRTPEAVIQAARDGVTAEKYSRVWGADANGLSSEEDIKLCAAAGYTYFTLSLSECVNSDVDNLSDEDLTAAAEELVQKNQWNPDWDKRYQGRNWNIHEGLRLTLEEDVLQRAAVKFAPVLAKVKKFMACLSRQCAQRPFEVELDLHNMSTPLTPAEHLFLAQELKRQGTILVSLAPTLPLERPDAEKDKEEDEGPSALESALRDHAAIARSMGPYKLVFYQIASDPERYPMLARTCREALHLKLIHLSTLEALRLISREARELFRETLAHPGYEDGSTDSPKTPLSNMPEDEWEQLFAPGQAEALVRHVLDILLAQGATSSGKPFHEAIAECLKTHAEAYRKAIIEALEPVLEALRLPDEG